MKNNLKQFIGTIILAFIGGILITRWGEKTWAEAFRISFGIPYVMYWPGWVWTYVFFSKKNSINTLERTIWSIALSMALITVGIYFSNTLLGIKITTLNSFLLILAFTGMGVIAHAFKKNYSDKG